MKTHPTLAFRQWLLQQGKRNDAVGDLARDVKQDSCFPIVRSTTAAKTIKQRYRLYLESRHASAGALDALDTAIDEYARFREGQEKPR